MTTRELFKSPRYDALLKHMVSDLRMTEEQAERFIKEGMPHMLDPNYLGHDEDGKPCKSLRRGL